jgi:hypothetical protein
MTVPQAAVSWRKSTRSASSGGTCVELGNTGGVRDSKNPTGPHLGTVRWAGLVALAKADTRSH